MTRLGHATRSAQPGDEAVLTGATGPTGATGDRAAPSLERAAAAVDGKADRALDLAVRVGRWLPIPGTGRTAERWRLLGAVAAEDLTAARVLEAHTDALAILAEAAADPDARNDSEYSDDPGADPSVNDFANGADGLPRRPGRDAPSWGVFAAEGPGVRVDARRVAGGWALTGTKPWCSLAGKVNHALITAHTGDGTRRLFAIELRGPGVLVAEGGWVAKGLTEVVSGPIDLLDCPARPVGPDGWYLDRPGFAWGGIGVAACWYGGAVGIARTLRDSLQQSGRRREPDQIAQMHVGAVDVALTAARSVLDHAAVAVDRGRARGADGALLAARVRAVVARTCEEVVGRVGHGLGPAPLATDERHARRVADLQLYLRQHHAERDEAALGRQVLQQPEWP